jgi:phenylacetate-CoA ligase
MPHYYRRYVQEDDQRAYPSAERLLADTLADAVANVPFYGDRASMKEIRSDPFSALANFPILERETVRTQGAAMQSRAGRRRGWHENTSGGSTGEPVTLIQDADHLAKTVAIRNVYTRWTGNRLGDPELYIWGSAQDLERGKDSRSHRIGNRLLRRDLLNAFLLTDDAISAILDELVEGEPRLVIAYAQAGYEVARFAAERGLRIPRQRGVIATAGTLQAFMRERLSSVFGCDVFNRYGSRETGDMAGECEYHTGLHVLPWTCHIEVLDADGSPVRPGEEGDIVVTSHTNRAMPLIRYRVGDRARMPSTETLCRCGRATQMLAAVTGRTVDMFVAEDGSMVDGEYFTHILYFRPWLKQFQVAQSAPDRVVYRLVTRSEIPKGDWDEIVEKTRLVLGEGCVVQFEHLDAIPPSASGKLRYTMREF